MIPQYDWQAFIAQAFKEDIGTDIKGGDHTSLSCIPSTATGSAKLLVKEDGVLAGVELAKMIVNFYDPEIKFEPLLPDGTPIKKGDLAFHLHGKAQSILSVERLLLNCMQRMSGVATLTSKFVEKLKGTNVKILDTRKTTPLFRAVEKWAVRIGGGDNHRFGLYDMIMIKDNHVDFAGGIPQAIDRVNRYLREKNLDLKIEIETRNIQEVQTVLETGHVHRIMLDNFKSEDIHQAVSKIGGKYEIEISGGITLDTIEQYAIDGVDFISVGAVTHSYKSLDLSLKAEFNA